MKASPLFIEPGRAGAGEKISIALSETPLKRMMEYFHFPILKNLFFCIKQLEYWYRHVSGRTTHNIHFGSQHKSLSSRLRYLWCGSRRVGLCRCSWASRCSSCNFDKIQFICFALKTKRRTTIIARLLFPKIIAALEQMILELWFRTID